MKGLFFGPGAPAPGHTPPRENTHSVTGGQAPTCGATHGVGGTPARLGPDCLRCEAYRPAARECEVAGCIIDHPEFPCHLVEVEAPPDAIIHSTLPVAPLHPKPPSCLERREVNHWGTWPIAREADDPIEPAAGDVFGDGDPPDWRGAADRGGES